MKKIISALLAAALSVTALTSCGSEENSTGTEQSYKTDVSPSDISATVNALLPISSELGESIPEMVMANFEFAAEYIEAHSVYMNQSGMTQDEYGILKVNTDENVEAVKLSVQSYLAGKLAAFTGDYTPEEKPKLENATVSVFGRYVVYCTLSEENTNLVLNTVNDILTGKLGVVLPTSGETVLLPSETLPTDDTPAELCAAVNAALPISSELTAPDPMYAMTVFNDVSEHLEAFSVLVNAYGMTWDEYGILKVDAEENIEAVKASVNAYLAESLAAFTDDYPASEKAKLENATVNVFGRFVVYCILSEENTQTVMNTVEETLAEK